MKIILLNLFVLLFLNLNAQSWEYIGTKWYYSKFDFWGISYSTIEIVGDTIINGQQCKIMEGGCTCGYNSKYMYEDANKVYQYDEDAGNFFLLYDFSVGQGESFNIYIDQNNPSFEIHVDSIGYIIVDNDTLKLQYISMDYTKVDLGDYLIEGIGSNRCMFPQGGVCDPIQSPLRCYDDSMLKMYNFNSEVPCDTIIIWTSIDNLDTLIPLEIYPNPTQNKLRIKLPELDKCGIRIYSIDGKKVYSNTVYRIEEFDINLEFLPKGSYFLEVTSSKNIYSAKFIKE